MSAEADALCAYLPALVRDRGITDRERKFIASVIHQRRRYPARDLSARQSAWLRRIVAAFQDRTLRDAGDEWRSIGEVADGIVQEVSDDG